MPVCQYVGCYHRQIGINWCNPFFMHMMKTFTERTFLLCSNGWSLELLMPWMEVEQIKLNLKWIEMRKETEVAKEMIDYFLKEKKLLDWNKGNKYYAYFHFFETHYPFHAPGYPRDGTARREALLYVDEQVGRILDVCMDDVDMVMCSDHNLPPQIVSAAFDVPAPRTMLSFIATNFTEIEKTYPGDHLKWIQEKYGVTQEKYDGD